MLDGVVVAAIAAASVVVLLYQGAALYFAAKMPHIGLGPLPQPMRWPTVSAIVAARNEEAEIGACLDGLLAQEYPSLEVIVVDGGSTDRTRELVEARGARIRLIDEPPLPPGWVGKNFACDVGSRAATGEYLLFVDADVRLEPQAIRTTVAWSLAEHAPLTSLAPRVETVGLWEQTVLPFYVQMVLTYFRAPRANLDRSRAAIANGQYLLVERAAYERLGGHSAVRGVVLEDIAIARRFRDAGERLRFGWAPELLTTRMYQDRKEMFEGISKNIQGTEFSLARQLGFALALVGFFWLPLAVLPLGLLTGTWVVTALGAVLFLALFGKHVAFAQGAKSPAVSGLLYPVAVGFYLVAVAESVRRGLRDEPVPWKGRRYAVPRKAATERTDPRHR